MLLLIICVSLVVGQISVNPPLESSDTEGTFLFDTIDQITEQSLGEHTFYSEITSEYEYITHVSGVMITYDTIIPVFQQIFNSEYHITMLPDEFINTQCDIYTHRRICYGMDHYECPDDW